MQTRLKDNESELLNMISEIWIASKLTSGKFEQLAERITTQEIQILQEIIMVQEVILPRVIELVDLHAQSKELAAKLHFDVPTLPEACTRESVLELSKRLDVLSTNFKATIETILKLHSNPEYSGSPSWEIVKQYNHQELVRWSKLNAEYLQNLNKSVTLRGENVERLFTSIDPILTKITKLAESPNALVDIKQNASFSGEDQKEEDAETLQASNTELHLPKGTTFKPFESRTEKRSVEESHRNSPTHR